MQEEAGKLLQRLNANTLFGLIQFSHSYDFFEDYLVTRTRGKKGAGVAWLEEGFRMDGKSRRGWTRSPENGFNPLFLAAGCHTSDGDF